MTLLLQLRAAIFHRRSDKVCLHAHKNDKPWSSTVHTSITFCNYHSHHRCPSANKSQFESTRMRKTHRCRHCNSLVLTELQVRFFAGRFSFSYQSQTPMISYTRTAYTQPEKGKYHLNLFERIICIPKTRDERRKEAMVVVP